MFFDDEPCCGDGTCAPGSDDAGAGAGDDGAAGGDDAAPPPVEEPSADAPAEPEVPA
ncbi:MAG: hypothetical protein QF755_01980 [Candidatus Peribacteraceae bacterium]|nr:hypothetical protein [Candidatus Peribacteraceae bacterium]|tara:strand:- start:4733 stop:4903 length:171 start_codon:yes stop_codon:yes gene_type:complete